MPHPEGYRKALRLMKQAEKFNRPIICFIDTKGAYPGKAAEERGQSEAIARNLVEMAGLDGSSHFHCHWGRRKWRALALGVANHIHMLENSSTLLFRQKGLLQYFGKIHPLQNKLAEAMKITAPHLKEMGIIDDIIPEVRGGAHRDSKAQAVNIGKRFEVHWKN